jgi:tetratricopeptide (TPR) repeat protein
MRDIQFMKEQERAERAEQELRELREKRELAKREQEAREREAQEQRAREQRERQERELKERDEKEREVRERAERAEQELRALRENLERERAEQEQRGRELEREAGEQQERGRELERELREKLERATQEREERERRAAAAQAATEDIFAPDEEAVPPVPEHPVFHRAPGSERQASAPPADEDFSVLGDELRDAEEDFGDLGAGRGREAAPAGAPAGGGTSDDFFDLAAELRDELSSIPVPERTAASAEEQSLDEIFEDFKKGVEQQESKQDVDTHYNLGIAYKEMGLLDDAVAEFLMTSEGEQKFVDSKYMLGLCYMEQGEYYKAIAEIHNALNYTVSFGGSQEEQLSMHYDLGLAYQGAGNVAEAISEFQRVSEMDPGYRDVEEKLKELQAGELISMEQLKEDIEKEISSKFLEEGERIEREEKTRKSDKVRN